MYPIYCINLEHRGDRKKHSLEQFEKIGISSDNVIYPHFVKDPRGGVYGCYDSHMKVWDDFFTKHPLHNFCLVFEDDFVATENSKEIIKKAIDFIDKNYEKVDILFLHNSNIFVENEINNEIIVNGYGITTTAYIITRHYIETTINKNGSIPEPNGIHFDCSINFDKNSILYTKNVFYAKNDCFKQLVDKSDNYLNIFDEIFRVDINTQVKNCKNIILFSKQINPNLNDEYIKDILYLIMTVVT